MLPDLPSLRFDNRTDIDALHFDTLDQNGVGFHVIVAKTAFSFGACGTDGQVVLSALDEAAPLLTDDRYNEDDIEQSVRLESDLAPYKPMCDVVVVGAAHAPGARPQARFSAALRVQASDQPAPLPPKPDQLNPMQSLSPKVYHEWQSAHARAKITRIAGSMLIDKTLNFIGERKLRRLPAPLRLFQAAVALATLGLVRLNPYRLTSPVATARVPLRYELAQGGQCRIEPGESGARRVAKRHRLSDEQRQLYPSSEAPVAHDSSQLNPHGRGFSRPWFLRAAKVRELPAPCVEYPAVPFSARRFWRNARGKPVLAPAGFGFVGRGWLPRRERAGTFQTQAVWGRDEVPLLPKDFDFRYWNGAPDDQQCMHLDGGEIFTLTNLCVSGAPFARTDEHGNTVLTFSLPRQSLCLLAADENDAVAALPLAIDTVVVDTDAGVVEIVWRRCLVADGAFAEARLIHAHTPEQLQRLQDWNTPDEEAVTAAHTPSLSVTL